MARKMQHPPAAATAATEHRPTIAPHPAAPKGIVGTEPFDVQLRAACADSWPTLSFEEVESGYIAGNPFRRDGEHQVRPLERGELGPLAGWRYRHWSHRAAITEWCAERPWIYR
ncbi:hypothetical protein FK529_09330 [Tsukamurella asaccharolytica]|uniref:Uncharacterized protein n=1 Tax=Tsukamurella asaccharolytica TaxID=2592067 RepID=A0A5C5RAS1_9ACTN|nr:hypothetical protein [Tsukamurella asaccharolytica]TWS19393.1 hypothetical protein FK529_09330 [Tsukamurella asaccharolytica]